MLCKTEIKLKKASSNIQISIPFGIRSIVFLPPLILSWSAPATLFRWYKDWRWGCEAELWEGLCCHMPGSHWLNGWEAAQKVEKWRALHILHMHACMLWRRRIRTIAKRNTAMIIAIVCELNWFLFVFHTCPSELGTMGFLSGEPIPVAIALFFSFFYRYFCNIYVWMYDSKKKKNYKITELYNLIITTTELMIDFGL